MRVKTILLLIFAVIVTILTALISHNKQYGKGNTLVDTAIFVSSRTMVPPEFLLAVLQEATEPDATPPYQTHEDEEIYLWVENQLFENQLFNVSSKHPYFNKRSFLQPQFTGNKPGEINPESQNTESSLGIGPLRMRPTDWAKVNGVTKRSNGLTYSSQSDTVRKTLGSQACKLNEMKYSMMAAGIILKYHFDHFYHKNRKNSREKSWDLALGAYKVGRKRAQDEGKQYARKIRLLATQTDKQRLRDDAQALNVLHLFPTIKQTRAPYYLPSKETKAINSMK